MSHGRGSSVSNDARVFDLADQGNLWSVSNVPPAPATEEAIVDCVAFLCGISHTLSTPGIFSYLFVHEGNAFVTWFLLGA